VLLLAAMNTGAKTTVVSWLGSFLGRKTMAAMKYEHDESYDEIGFLKHKLENYRLGLIEIVQMEKYPTESDSDNYDGLYPTGQFALKVLKGEWPK
jgi:hypothetical protein